MFKTAELFDLQRVPAHLRALLDVEYPWQALALLDDFGGGLQDRRPEGSVHRSAVVDGTLYMEDGAEVGPCAYLTGPIYLAKGAKVGHAAYIRGPVVLGPNAHVMHASEVKRSILLGGAKAPHFNYVGDSVVGHNVNLGAGVKLANFKTMGTEINVEGAGIGLRKFGSALGDDVSVGCNAVLSPGTVVGQRTVIYNLASVRGVVPADTIIKYSPSLTASDLRR